MNGFNYLSIEEITKKYLLDNKFDGLYNEEGCACVLEDLMSCGEPDVFYCKAGYRLKLTEEEEEEYGFKIGEIDGQ